MFYYQLNNKVLISALDNPQLHKISEETAQQETGVMYALFEKEPQKSRKYYCISDSSLLFLDKEGLNLLLKPDTADDKIPQWLMHKIQKGQLAAVNTAYPNWQDVLDAFLPEQWKIHVVGLGDVGGTLLSGLRLLGADCISQIGIYDTDINKVKRWEYEINQIRPSFSTMQLPKVYPISETELFDCDMFVFCVSVGVPPVGNTPKDVRIAQLEGNSSIISTYAQKARENHFKGIFAVVSDPVDLLCKAAYLASNRNADGKLDAQGLTPEQIRGYGLGVMHARAAYYAEQQPEMKHYLQEGRVFGSHGEELVVADSIENYNEAYSLELTQKAKTANLAVRETGFKPYIAPALSSGTFSLIATIKGEWHYSAVFMGGMFMGCKNRLTSAGTEIEGLHLPQALITRLQNTYDKVGNAL